MTDLNGQSAVPSGTTYIYQQMKDQSQQNAQQQEYAQRASEWANKMQAANVACCHAQQASYLQQIGKEASQKQVVSQSIGF